MSPSWKIEELDSIPEGFDRTPMEILAPLLGPTQGIWVGLKTEELETILMPDLANETGGELQITAPIQLDLDSKWRGTSNITSRMESAPLGTLRAGG